MINIQNFSKLSKQLLDVTTPKKIDSNLKRYIDRIDAKSKPIFLNVEPREWSRLQCCDTNVEEMIKLKGGEIVFGHKIWYNKDLFAENELHAVWKDKEGKLIDITFNISGEKRILFIPDERITSIFRPDGSHKIRMVFKAKHQEWLNQLIEVEKLSPFKRPESMVDPNCCPTWKEYQAKTESEL